MNTSSGSQESPETPSDLEILQARPKSDTLDKLLVAVQGLNDDSRLRSTNDILEKILASMQGVQSSMDILAQNLVPKSNTGREDYVASGSWREERIHLLERMDVVNTKFELFSKELDDLEEHYRSIGGDQGVIESSSAFRLHLHRCASEVSKVLKLEKSLKYDDLHGTRTCMEDLSETFITFHDSLYVQKHAFYFRAIRRWQDIMHNGNTKLEVLLRPQHYLKYVLDDLFCQFEAVIPEVVRELNAFREKSLPYFLVEEKERATTRYVNITTIATFFSSVTATTLQFSFQSTQTTLGGLVNLFWFVSLVFSVSSGINSLLGMTWRKSKVFHSEAQPKFFEIWLDKAPMILLIIAAVTFVIGLNLFSYLSSQPLFVSVITNLFTFIHGACLLVAVSWFICRLKYNRNWSVRTRHIAKKITSFVAVISSPIISIVCGIVSTFYWIFILLGLQVKLLSIWIMIFLAKFKLMNYGPKFEDYILHFLRMFYWILALDNRVANINAVIRQDREWPNLGPGASNIRTILNFVQSLKDFVTHFSLYVDEQRRRFKPDVVTDKRKEKVWSLDDTTPEALEDTSRRSLVKAFGDSSLIDLVIETIRRMQSMQYTDSEREASFKRQLRQLLWGYPALADQMYNKHLVTISALPRIDDAVVLDNVVRKRESSDNRRSGSVADVWEGIRNGRRVALKVLRFYGDSKSRKVTFQALVLEAPSWQQIKHENVLSFLGLSSEGFEDPLPAIVTPWVENGNLLDYLNKHQPIKRTPLILGVARGLAYLHNCHPVIVHGDLRAANVMMSDEGQPKITDFGLVKMYEQEHGSSFDPVRWLAPELLIDIGPEEYTTQSDVYAFAYVCIEIFTQKIPFDEMPLAEVMMRVNANERPPRPEGQAVLWGLTEEIWNIIQSCWVSDPDDRLDMISVVNEIENIGQQAGMLEILENGSPSQGI